MGDTETQPIDRAAATAINSEGDVHLFKHPDLRDFTCAACGKSKPSRSVAIPMGDWSVPICNGCFGEYHGGGTGPKAAKVRDLVSAIKAQGTS